MTDVCRLCLGEQSVKHLIFDDGDILIKIVTCLPINVSQSDNLPRKICNRCSLKLNDIYPFFKRVIDVERRLLQSINGHQTVLKSPQKCLKNEWPNGIKDEPKEPLNSTNSRSNEETVIVLNNNSSLKQSHILPKTNYTSQCTQTELCLMEIPQATAEIAHIQLDDTLMIKEENEFEDYVDNFTDQVDQYSSDDDLTLNKIVKTPTLKIEIKKESVDGIICKKKKAKKKKKDNKQDRKENIEVVVEKKKRGRPKGSTNKLAKKICKVADEGLVKLEDGVKEEKNLKAEYDGDKRFYPEGTAEEAKKWQCLTCFSYQHSRTELLQHYKDHVENPASLMPVVSENGANDSAQSIDSKFKEEDASKTDPSPAVKIKTEDYLVINAHSKEEKGYQCTHCSKILPNKRAISRHLISHDTARPFPCNLCGRSYKRAYEILLHGRAHNGVKTLFCRFEECNYSTVYRGALISHHKRHEPDYKYICDICKKGFDVLTWFKEHMNIHTGAKPFSCDLCGKNFVYSRYLASHRKTVHPQTSALLCKHRCPHCALTFPHRKTLRAHAARVHNARSEGTGVLCDVCGKELSSREHLKFHRRTHTGEKPYVCRTCGKGFVKKCNLTLHERVHSGERPHVCSHCGKAFSQRSTLVIHERYHSGSRPYECQICHKGFVAKGLLSMHAKGCL